MNKSSNKTSKNLIKSILCIIAILILLFVLFIPIFAISVQATIILIDSDGVTEVARFYAVVQDSDEIPFLVQYDGDVYAFEYGSGEIYEYYMVENNDEYSFSGYWYGGYNYNGDIDDLPYPPGYQPDEPSPELIQISFVGFREGNNNNNVTLYTSVIYGEPSDSYTWIPLYVSGYVPEYNSYSGYFGASNETINIEYFPLQIGGDLSKQVNFTFVYFSLATGSYITLYSSTINIDRSYTDFDTRSVYDNINFVNASPYIDIDFNSNNLDYYIYLVNITDSSRFIDYKIYNYYEIVRERAFNQGVQQGYNTGLTDANPNTIDNFIPKAMGSVVTSAYYVMSNIKVGNVSLLIIVSTVVCIGIILLLIKIFKR